MDVPVKGVSVRRKKQREQRVRKEREGEKDEKEGIHLLAHHSSRETAAQEVEVLSKCY